MKIIEKSETIVKSWNNDLSDSNLIRKQNKFQILNGIILKENIKLKKECKCHNYI